MRAAAQSPPLPHQVSGRGKPILVLIQLKMNLKPGPWMALGDRQSGPREQHPRAAYQCCLPAPSTSCCPGGTQSTQSLPWLQMPEARSFRAPKPSSIFSPSISPSNSCKETLCLAGQGSIAVSNRSAADKGGTAALPRHRHVPRWGLQGLLPSD